MGKENGKSTKIVYKNVHTGGLYFITYIGTLVYFLNNADGFWEVVLSFLQALVWPALLVYRVFQILHIA
jgi:hypothetical protein